MEFKFPSVIGAYSGIDYVCGARIRYPGLDGVVLDFYTSFHP